MKNNFGPSLSCLRNRLAKAAFALAVTVFLPLIAQSQVLLEDNFDGASGAAPDSTNFTWGGEVSKDGVGSLYFGTWSVNTSWLQSKTNVALSAGSTMVLKMRAYAYAEPAVYGDKQPRGLRVGSDANNAVEFYSHYGTTLGMRARKNGVETAVTSGLSFSLAAMHDYEISLTTTSAVFKLDGVVRGTITNNIPTGALNFYVSTFDGYAGNVPVYVDSVLLSNSPAGTPPVITIQPTNQTVVAGSSTTLSVVATGTEPLAYQWFFNGSTLPNATNSALALAAVDCGNKGSYLVVITNAFGSVTSSVAAFDIFNRAPVASPGGPYGIILGNSVSLDASASSDPDAACGDFIVAYDWDLNLDGVADAHGVWPTLTYATLNGIFTGGMVGEHTIRLIVADSRGATGQITTTLTILQTFYQDNDSDGFGNSSITTNAATRPTGYVGVSGDCNDSVAAIHPGVTEIGNGIDDDCDGAVDEEVLAPFILFQPEGSVVNAGSNVAFTVTDGGANPRFYQWRLNGVNIVGATNISLILSNVSALDQGNYTLFITNAFGTASSSAATLTVNRLEQAILFGALLPKRLDDPSFTLNATASSGLAVSYVSMNTNVVVVNGNRAEIKGIGTAAIVATQSGNEFYLPAADVARSLSVACAPGTVVAWGRNAEGQINVPAGLSNVVAVAGGFYHSLALRSDGTIVGWGKNNYGQATAPADLTNVTAISGGNDFTMAVKSDGTVAAWGNNSNGQTNVPPGLSNVTAVAAGYYHALALKGDGTVQGWGRNDYGQATIAPNLTNVIAIGAGADHSIVLLADGTVVAWGRNDRGQTNVPGSLSNVTAVSTKILYNLALKTNGTLAAWGRNDYGEAQIPMGLSGVAAIAAGCFHSVVLKTNGTVSAWGDTSYQQSVVPTGLSRVTAISAGSFHTLAIVAPPEAVSFVHVTNNGAITITGCTGANGAVTIPSAINGWPVRVFGTNAFYSKTNLTSVSIPNSVTNIESQAFRYCSSLTNIIFGNSVATIGVSAFSDNSSLASLSLPNSVTSIGESAFSSCTNMASVIIPDSVTNISYGAFSYCSGLTNAVIGNGVGRIPDAMFFACNRLKNVVIPGSVTSIGYQAFRLCSSLPGMTIPNSVTTIGDYAFDSCIGLKSVVIPDSMVNVGSFAFNSCGGLTNVAIGNSVTNIGGRAFMNCSALISITFPNSVISIGDYAFYYCTSLTTMVVGNRVATIGGQAISYCTSLTRVYFRGDAPSLAWGNSLYGSTLATVYRLPDASGWPPVPELWGGRPTALWSITPQVPLGSFGVVSNRFGFTLNWPGMQGNIIVEGCTNLSSPVWQPLSTNTLINGSSDFSDSQWTNYPGRFYRLRSQ